MEKIEFEEVTLIGLSLNRTTTNANGQANLDCGNLWQKFEKEKYAEKIPGKLSDEVLAVYHQYEGDHTKPFSYFIGCKVKPGTKLPPGLDGLTIPRGSYQKIIAKGKMPDCVVAAWKQIWNSGISRAYRADFEVYDERSRDWNNAIVDIFLSV